MFSATTSPNSPPTSLPYASHITHKRSHSDALADLAFTGATTLSSSALAHLTSRLSLRDQSPEKNGSGVYSSNPNDQHTVFDPYAQQSQHQQQQQYITESPTDDHRASEDGYTVGCAAALDVSSVFRRRSGKAGPKAIGSRRAKSLHVSASATFIHAERHHTPPPPLPQTTGLKRSSQAPVSFFDSWYGGEDAVATTTTMRRWTLALTDVSDEVLVQELEKIRKEGREMERERKKCIIANGGAMNSAAQGGDGTQPRGRRTSGVGSPPSSTSFVYGGPSIIDPVAPRSQRTAKFHIGGDGPQSAEGCESDDDIPDGTEEFLDDDPSTEDEEAGWKTARRALLCCRELVRTERTYQTHLRQLLQGDVQFDPQSSSLPPLILTHLPALLFASEVFLSRLEDDPSAWGVSAALLACEEDIERAFVSWCEVVGDLFVNSDPSSSVSSEEKATSHSPRKLVRKSTVSTSESSGESKSRVGSTFGGRGRARSVASVVSSSNSHESAYRPRATSYYGSLSASPPPAPVPTSYYVIRGHPYNPAGPSGMFTAALGTGLAYGISPPSPPDPVTDSGSSRTISPGQFGTTPTSAIGHPFAFGSTSGLGRTFTAWRRRSFVSPSSSLPSGLPGLHLSLTGLSSSGTSGHGHGNGNNGSRERKPTVRELAIQPTQRVMRYVLQYRGAFLCYILTLSYSRC